MISVVFFDLVGTLIRPREPVGHQYSALARRFGADLDPAVVESAFHVAMRAKPASTPTGAALEATAQAERQWWADLVRSVVRSCGASQLDRPGAFDEYFRELYEHFTTAGAWSLYDDTIPALEALAGRGAALGLITNYDTRVYRLLDAVGLAAHLDSVTIPANAGVSKPDEVIFAHALAAHGVSPAQALHVGDSPGDDYDGARTAGLNALLLDRDGRHAGKGMRTIRGLGEVLPALGALR